MSQMLSLEERVKISMRRGSAVPIQKNPLEASKSSSNEDFNIKVSAAIDARPITAVESLDLITRLRGLQSDPTRFLEHLDNAKNPFLLYSNDLLQILGMIEANKHKLTAIGMVVPRLVDPKSSLDQVVNMFRFAEEKAQVEELYRERIQFVNAAVFKKDKPDNILGRSGRGGGAGRGGAGRGGQPRPTSLPVNLSEETVQIFHPMKTTDDQEEVDPATLKTDAEKA